MIFKIKIIIVNVLTDEKLAMADRSLFARTI